MNNASSTTNSPIRLLIVDDEEDIRQPLCQHLENSGFTTCAAANADEAYVQLDKHSIDLVVLDVMMPGTSGLEVCRKLSENDGPPVILLTALTEDIERIIGLEIGADDYVSKPFNPRELVARIRSVLRRTQRPGSIASSKVHAIGEWQWHSEQGELHHSDETVVMLSTGESRLLKVFVENPNKILSRDELINLTQGRDSFPYERSIDNMVSRLRRKIEADLSKPKHIQTVWGGGYKFSAD